MDVDCITDYHNDMKFVMFVQSSFLVAKKIDVR